jgi:hypothetical protein
MILPNTSIIVCILEPGLGSASKTDPTGSIVKTTANFHLIFIRSSLRLPEKCVACGSHRIQITGRKYLIPPDRLSGQIKRNSVEIKVRFGSGSEKC